MGMCFEIPADQAENVEALIHAYPEFVKIDDLPSGTQEEKLTTVNALYDRGLVVTKETLDGNWMYSDDDDDDDSEEELGKVLVVDGDLESGDESGVEEDEEKEDNGDNDDEDGDDDDDDDDDEPPEPVQM